MPNLRSLEGIVGADNITPSYDPHRGFHVWGEGEIYEGLLGEGKHIPLLGDLSATTTGGRIDFFVVTDMNQATGVATLTPQIKDGYPTYFEPVDTLIAPGYLPELYRLYVDKSVTPNRVMVDTACFVHASVARSCKVFMGTDIGPHGTVISRVYDGSGNYVGDTVALELVAIPNAVNYSVKSVPGFFTNYNLQAGGLVTIVFYGDTGLEISRRQLKVEESAYVHSIASDKKYVVSIALESPFLSKTDASMLEYPLNLPVAALQLYGRVFYSDGSSASYPVDGSKFSVAGLDDFLSTQVGATVDFLLLYKLSAEESTTAAVTGDNGTVVNTYTVKTMAPDQVLGIKLYVYPEWSQTITGYTLKVFALSLARDLNKDVTSLVTYTQALPYDPRSYGTMQHLRLQVNLNDIDARYPNYLYAQTVSIKLNGPGTLLSTRWIVENPPNQTPGPFGTSNFALATLSQDSSTWYINLTGSETTQVGWINRFYALTKPLYSPNSEVGALAPTHVSVSIGGIQTIISVNDWSLPMSLPFVYVTPSTQAYLTFMRKVGSTWLYLSVAAIPIARYNAQGIAM